MAGIGRSVLTLRIFGDDLDPDEISALLNAEPTASARKGDARGSSGRPEAVWRTGFWRLNLEDRIPGDLEGQLDELFSRLSLDAVVWEGLAKRFQADVFCGLFMEQGNEGFELSPRTLAALGVRNLTIGFDIYDPSRD